MHAHTAISTLQGLPAQSQPSFCWSLTQRMLLWQVSGQAITQQSFQQMLKGVTGSIQHGLSYPQFVQLITRDHVVMVDPQDGRGSPRAVRLCHDNKEVGPQPVKSL